jgi:predicted amidohydrolase YtcJ
MTACPASKWKSWRLSEKNGLNGWAYKDALVFLPYDPILSCNPYNPFLGLYNLVARKTENGETILPEQKVSRERALKMYTIEGAFASFDEKEKGSLEVGKLADLAVLSKDFLTCPEEEILSIESELTMVGGKVVYAKT